MNGVMRTRLAILLAAVVATTIAASALMTSQLGMRDWPTAPSPDTATRLITPSEAAGRAADATSSDGDGDLVVERAERDHADRGADDRSAERRPTVPVRTRTPSRRRADERAEDDPPRTPASEPAVVVEPEDGAPAAPEAIPATAPDAPAPADAEQHTREDEQPATPAPLPDLLTELP